MSTSNSLKLPTTLDAKSNKILMFDCLLLLGDELGNYYDTNMRKLQGDDWLRLLAQQRNNYNLTINDPDFVIKEPLRSDSPLRAILPKSPSLYKNLDVLRKIRNHIAHNSLVGELSQTKAVLESFFQVSLDLNLQTCMDDYSKALIRLNFLEQGGSFDDEPRIEIRIEGLEKNYAEIEEELYKERTERKKAEERLEEALSKVSIKEAEYEELILNSNFQEIDRKAIFDDVEKFRLESKNLRIKLAETEKIANQLQNKEELIKSLVVSLAESTKFNESDFDENLYFHDEFLINNELVPKQAIGSLWKQEKGKMRVTLSISKRDLIDPRTNQPLNTLESKVRKQIAEHWLQIRPSGGRVFIDHKGNASTLNGSALVYLGTIPRISEN